jgi:hypothetical protein
MKKVDERTLNRYSNRILSIEMTYWIWWHGKTIDAEFYKDRLRDGKKIEGKIVDVRYKGNSFAGVVIITLENGVEFPIGYMGNKNGMRPRKEDLKIIDETTKLQTDTAKKLLSLITKPEPKTETPLQHALKQGLKEWNENRGNCNASFLYPDKDTPPKSKVIPEEVFDEMMLGGLE